MGSFKNHEIDPIWWHGVYGNRAFKTGSIARDCTLSWLWSCPTIFIGLDNSDLSSHIYILFPPEFYGLMCAE